MFLVVCSAVTALACRDIERPLQPSGPKAPREIQGPPVVAALTCELDGTAKTVVCATPASPPEGVSASVIYGSVPGFAQFYPVSLVKDTVAHTWQFTAYVQNLLKQSIGTLNGTTVTGVKVFITDFHATAGTGTVSVANADGTGNFTAPNQPYFNYNQIVAPAGYTSNKLWKFNVPNTVTAVSMSILISTDFPAEQTVTSTPPTAIPDWVQADTNLGGPTAGSVVGVKYFKRVIRVFFKPSATLADRQLAVALVNGVVVGGWRALDGTGGFYVVQVPDDGTGNGVMSASAALQSLPQVAAAGVWSLLGGLYLKPNDGADFSQWSLNPDSTNASGKKWSLESIDAPYAWGCSNGSYATKVGVIDNGFHAVTDLVGNFSASAAFVSPSDTNHHATLVSAILAARGNNGIGITGAMWNATILARDPALDTISGHVRPGFDPYWAGYFIGELASKGARVVNMSVGQEYFNNDGTYRTPGSFGSDAPIALTTFNQFKNGIRQGQADFHVTTLPLIVIAAGNFNQAGANGTTDSWWSILPRIADSLHDTVIVVGASTQARTVAKFSGANSGGHSYVDIMAPGQGVYGLKVDGSPDSASGTSLSAPLVAAAAGLLVSFDSTLGAPVAGHGAPELKQLILAGADSNTTPAGVKRQAGTYNLLSLYKPLVLAAKRKGAPVCRNRIWATDHGVVVRRNSTLLDTIYTSSALIRDVETYHGGRRIDIVTRTSDSLPARDSLSLYQNNGGWASHARGPINEYSPTGSYRSIDIDQIFVVDTSQITRSHNGDSTAAYRHLPGWNYSGPYILNIVVRDTNPASSDHLIGQLTHPVYDAFALSISPRGDAVYAATGNQTFAGWGLEVWKVPTHGSVGPTVLFAYKWGFASYLSVSEDGSEVMVAMATVSGTDTLPGHVAPWLHQHCVLEYRSSTSGALLDSMDLGENKDLYPCFDSKSITASGRRVASAGSPSALIASLFRQ